LGLGPQIIVDAGKNDDHFAAGIQSLSEQSRVVDVFPTALTQQPCHGDPKDPRAEAIRAAREPDPGCDRYSPTQLEEALFPFEDNAVIDSRIAVQ
jgi:hypothetical protein